MVLLLAGVKGWDTCFCVLSKQPFPPSDQSCPRADPLPHSGTGDRPCQPCYCAGGAAGSCGSWNWCPPGCMHGEWERLDLPAGLWHISGLCSCLDFSPDGGKSFHWKGLLWKGLQSALAICSGWPSGKCANLHLSMSLHAFGRGKASWLSGVCFFLWCTVICSNHTRLFDFQQT